jgi:outer membrane protein OmpA-like peptidoglycan-associated protein
MLMIAISVSFTIFHHFLPLCENRIFFPMTRTTALLLFFILTDTAYARHPKQVSDPFPKMATVNVTVPTMKAIPANGEEVIFRGEQTGKTLSGISDISGKIKLVLPPGDNYHVSVKSISDTTQFAVITVPALAEDECFTEPFRVQIKFDPPRHYRLDNVHFDFDKASLCPDSYIQLKELLEYLQRHEDIKIEIAGHTDTIGNDAHNLKLSQERANTIRNYLMSKGIKATKLTAKGYGVTYPVADNSSEDGRQLNRRTEVRI